MSRSVKEWRGRTDDAMPPPSVRARIFAAHNGICHISKRKIRPGEPWHLDHIKELWEGGENRESNMAPALVEPHKGKTAKGQRRKAKADRIKAKHLGIKKPKGSIPGSKASGWKRKMDGTVVRRER